MAYEYSELLQQTRQWAQTAHNEGRLSADALEIVDALEMGASPSLFADNAGDHAQRPLIVAFMGGTGVGKSSLLNRLAGQAIARAGIERPTSREVTLYHYHTLSPQYLPAGLPIDSIKVSQHYDETQRHIVWIDMPDFDSVELHNRQLVLEWLPHIDVLLYVVSPERYRDNKAWQLLQSEGAKHAWLFVMNQWDRGQSVQFDDFKQQLAKAGFKDPLLYRTSCSEPVGDNFAQLLGQIQQLSGSHNIVQLQQRAAQVRRMQLLKTMRQLEQDFGVQEYPALLQFLDSHWPEFESQLNSGLEWLVLQLSKFWVDHLGQKTELKIWDDWAQNRLNDLLDEMIVQADQYRIPGKALKSSLQGVRAHSGDTVVNKCELAGRQALLNPGNWVQRLFLKLTAVCETLLPLAAMSVVGYQVYVGFYRSTTEATSYLGSDFAIHSLLLVAMSWLIPFFLHKKLQPSLQKAAYQGLQKGLKQALANLRAEIRQNVLNEERRTAELSKQLLELLDKCEVNSESPTDESGVIKRVLLNQL